MFYLIQHVRLGLIISSLVIWGGCATVDRDGVQAVSGSPQSSQVEIASIPYDSSRPTFVLFVEPLNYGASGITSGGYSFGPGPQVGTGIAAQLTTALSNCGNIVVVDAEALGKDSNGAYTCQLNDGELGPFIIRGTVTEFNETADLQQKKRRIGLGPLGLLVGLGGAYSGNSAAMLGGGATAIANPNYSNQKMRRKGMVAMDLRVMDGRNLRMLSGFNSSGTFITESATSGASVFGIGGSNQEFASSALGQATRVAMNDAIQKISDALQKAR